MKNLAAKLEIAERARVNLCLMGRHGIGKTEVIGSWAAGKGYHLETLILSLMEPVILGGMPDVADYDSGTVGDDAYGKVTLFAVPEWLVRCKKAAAEGKKVVVFLDEFNRADPFSRNAAMNFLTTKRVHNHELPEDTMFIAAINPETEGDSGVYELEDPLVDRFVHIPVTVDENSWLDWATGSGVNSLVTGFIATNPAALNGFELDFTEGIGSRILPTPRSTVYLGKITDAIDTLIETGVEGFAGKKTPEILGGVGYDLIRGSVGNEIATEYLAYTKSNFHNPFTTEEILSGSESVIERATDLRNKQINAVLTVSLETARTEIATKYENNASTVKDGDLDGFFTFLRIMPLDLIGAFFVGGDENFSEVTTFWNEVALAGPTDIQDIILNDID